ncbi:MAG: hypothetical protein DRO87_09825 [Candidatus Thorarchaeota archaeon]|nr:MAG: hypothetical protein DRO87_09825 [Candidatus Thorarchaeota archaeon]RLI55621.1 MAG: hypothetical protein DRP09_09385 [Candidatus Thorarchaeota archaeon]
MIEWILGLCIGLFAVMLSYSLAFFVMTKVGDRVLGDYSSSQQWKSNVVIGPIVITISVIIIFLLSSGNLYLWGFTLIGLDHLLVVLVFGTLLAVCVLSVSEHYSPSPPDSARDGRRYFLLIVVIASTSEELLFRGVVQNVIDYSLMVSLQLGYVSITSGALTSALVFALLHSVPAKSMGVSPVFLVVSSLFLGLAAGVAFTETASLIAPILVHALFNSVGFVVTRRQGSGNTSDASDGFDDKVAE